MIWLAGFMVLAIILELFAFKKIKDLQCPVCGGKLTKVIGWEKMECKQCAYTRNLE